MQSEANSDTKTDLEDIDSETILSEPEHQHEEEEEQAKNGDPEKTNATSRERKCCKICINYEPTKRTLKLGGSKSATTGIPHLVKPPETDEEDSRLPRAFFWTVAEVGQWISNIGFPQYKQCLDANHITGRQLILLNANTLPQMGITNFDDMKIILKKLHNILGITPETSQKTIAALPREEIALYMELKSRRGEKSDRMTYEKFLHECQDAIWQPQHLSNVAFMAPPEQRIQVPALRK